MPLVEFLSSHPAPHEAQAALLAESSTLVAAKLKKPLAYVMVRLDDGPMCFAGSEQASCMIRVEQIGPFAAEAKRDLTKDLTALATRYLGVPETRVFMIFTAVEARDWSLAGKSLG